MDFLKETNIDKCQYIMTIYVLELTNAIVSKYFDAILKEFIGKTLKFIKN